VTVVSTLLANRAGMSTTTTGTGDITLGSALGAVPVNQCAFLDFATAGITNGQTVSYLILDSNGGWECGHAAYNSTGPKLTGRTVSKSSNAGALLNLSGVNVQVYITALAEDMVTGGVIQYDQTQSLTTPQQGVALKNIGAAQFNLINGKLVESHASNAATFAIKTLAGSDPSASDPVTVIFPDGSVLAITAALSLTLPSGCTFGVANSAPFRLWFFICNDNGTPRIGVRWCVSVPVSAYYATLWIAAPDYQTSSAITTPAQWALTYTDVAMSTARPYRYIARVEYDSGLATAGSWNVSPSRIVLVSATSVLPGGLIQRISQRFASQSSSSSTTPVQSVISRSISISSIYNQVYATAQGDCQNAAAATVTHAFIGRGSSSTLICGDTQIAYATNTVVDISFFLFGIDMPGTTASTTYSVYYYTAGAGTTLCPATQGSLNLDEIMG